MTDCHCHQARDEVRHFLCSPFVGEVGKDDRVFIGTHPWYLDDFDPERLCMQLAADDRLGVGEIGLDRLKERVIPPRMREVFASQLAIAAEFRRPVMLHGAKCWGEVVRECKAFKGAIPAFVFHGFSRSEGLLSDIRELNGFISVGPAVLNDHAVNYRELVKRIPDEMLLIETDLTAENAVETPSIVDIYACIAALRGIAVAELERMVESNADQL